jgi:pyruvate kinase
MLSGESAVGAYPVEAVAMLARIAATVEPTRRHVPVSEKFAGVDLTGRIRPEHLIAVSIESSLEYLQPAAVFVPSASGATARRLAALHLPVPVVAICARERTGQNLQFSYGVAAVVEGNPPSPEFVRAWVREHQLPGEFAILTQRFPADDPRGNHRMEIVLL